MKPAIRVDKLSKLYRIGRFEGTYRTLRESLTAAATAPLRALRRSLERNSEQETSSCTDFWALKDVSFEVQPGEVVGLIGRNGAGKSTLLKVLSRITEPTEGRVLVRGRMGSLLEVGTGFHHELTGRENIFLNGAILGMARREIQRKFDEIVAFAEIEQFLDTPVKRYSSGMFVRLAFAVAAYLEPEILLVDEVLAVGDFAFQKKCMGRMSELSRSGRTVIFVSHQMASITNLCESAIVLESGRIDFVGEASLAVERYAMERTILSGGDVDLTTHANRRPGGRALLRRVRLLGRNGLPTDHFRCGDPMVIELWVDSNEGPTDLHFCVAFEDPQSGHLFRVGTHLTESEIPPTRGARRLRCSLSELPLVPGRYWLTLSAGTLHDMRQDWIERAISLDVVDADYYGNGILRIVGQKFLVKSQWQSFDWDKPVPTFGVGQQSDL